jgi:hypothetical protein
MREGKGDGKGKKMGKQRLGMYWEDKRMEKTERDWGLKRSHEEMEDEGDRDSLACQPSTFFLA